ncbi:rhomboid family intramembrane serine protease [bacterium]|nr:rhomboid family intramembrane serine protease [bacterium]
MSDGKAGRRSSPWQRPGEESWLEEQEPNAAAPEPWLPAEAPISTSTYPIRLTWVLLGLLLLAACLGGVSQDLGQLRRLGARPPLYGFNPRPEHMLLPLFLHGGTAHFLSNFLSLFMVGSALEYVLGGLALLYLFLCAGVISLLGSMFHDPQAMSVGCSGSVFGIWAARVLHAWLPPREPDRFRFLALFVFSLVLTVVPKAMGMPVDDLGHVAGLAGGGAAYLAWRAGKLARVVFLLALFGFCGWVCRPPWIPF